ncbi:preprotein translocase subunit SecE [Haloimpatiens sp. FM7315]|uniref:preprotein translocase subunit SecE n=1 Tax=Haloimpatiens sp. FM7315 TaxID=3298609 RepID=UPI00370B4E70
MASNGDLKAKSQSKKGLIGFFVDLKAEFKRFTWPTRKDIKKALMAVITFCVIYVIIVGLLDKGFASLFNLVFFK